MSREHRERRTRPRLSIPEIGMLGLIALVLVASIFPVQGMFRNQKLKTEARAEVTLVVGAIRAFRDKYNVYPLDPSVVGVDVEYFETQTDAKFMAMLTGQDTTANRQGVVLYDTSRFGNRVGRLDADGGLTDPWGRPYHVRIDAVEDKEKSVGVIPGCGEEAIRESAVVWSVGGNPKQDDCAAWIRTWE